MLMQLVLRFFPRETVLCLISLMLTAPSVQAAFSNYNSVLIGEKAAGLGGAATALVGDPAASPFYNPATTVLLEGSSLSATVNVYNKYETDLGGVTDFAEAPQKVNRGFFRSLPAASGTILNFKSFAVGLSILVPDYDFYSGQVKGSDNTNSFLTFTDESLWVGGTFSGRLTENDAVGFTVYYTARNLTRSVSDRATSLDNTSATLLNEEKNLSANSIVSIFGIQRRLSPSWSVGLSYRPQSIPVTGEASYYLATTSTSPYSSEIINRGHLRAITKIPAKLALGFVREIKGQNLFSLDVQMYESLAYRDLPELSDRADLVEHQNLVNFAIGYEQILRDWLSLRLGFFSNFSSHPEPDIKKGARQGDHIDMRGFSANFNVRTKDKTSFTFGGYYSGGSGRSTQIVANELTVVPKSQQVFTMLVATGFYF